MKKLLLLSLLLVSNFYAAECSKIYGNGATELKLATGSPGELGLLEALANSFNAKNDTKICWIKAGSGKGLKLLEDGKVDISMTHSPKEEKELVTKGAAKNRTLIGSNEFYIIGPKDDPAQIKTAKTAAQAYTNIANKKALFYTRDDKSGTHVKELSIWKLANITPSGKWYKPNRDFMLATLRKADETKGYFMSDSSTYKSIQNELKNSEVLFAGDKVLVNVYVAMSAKNAPKEADKFIEFLKSDEAQEIFQNYGKKEFGVALYEDASYAQKYFIP
ncbi:substrate-binding domain-containing protein [Campylobacter sp. RM13119]|uniref:substrate-binding domain-containing protein n=1 Tax=Campylobacter TaxID=194 RepID=UPI0014742818|nr:MULTISPECIES: substrate-binding domain-containing protein [unclassified Campylobacter]MBE3605996.1 substrate-binding domain-containing protein [Campylobacter sp. RM13119]